MKEIDGENYAAEVNYIDRQEELLCKRMLRYSSNLIHATINDNAVRRHRPVEQMEKQMYLMKLMLVLMRDRKAKQGQVRSVGYIREYGEMPDELGVYTLGQLSDEQIIALAEELGVKKRPAVGKSDIYMNDLGYALVWSQGTTVLVDQAEVKEVVSLAQKLNLPEESVKQAVAWHQQQTGSDAGSDVVMVSGANSPYYEYRENWVKLIAYWSCQGTAQEVSRFPADYVLSFEDALNMNTWEIYEPQRYVELIWDHLQFTFNKDEQLTVTLSR